MDENTRDWKILLNKDLADYPDIVIEDKKRELAAERKSLNRHKARIESELEALPQTDPAEVELALTELAKPWQMSDTGPYPHPMSWERRSIAEGTWEPDMPRKLSEEQAHLLRETLLKLNCRITIKNRVIFISGRLALDVRAKQGTS